MVKCYPIIRGCGFAKLFLGALMIGTAMYLSSIELSLHCPALVEDCPPAFLKMLVTVSNGTATKAEEEDTKSELALDYCTCISSCINYMTVYEEKKTDIAATNCFAKMELAGVPMTAMNVPSAGLAGDVAVVVPPGGIPVVTPAPAVVVEASCAIVAGVNVAACKCGTASCIAGQVCTAASNECNTAAAPLAACVVLAGENAAACKCGTADCLAAQVCTATTNTCAAAPLAACGVVAGVNAAACKCGTADCSADQVCTAETNTCADPRLPVVVRSEEMPACIDYTVLNNPKCWTNMLWAKDTGVKLHPEWYPTGTTTFTDFQCALYVKGDLPTLNGTWLNYPGKSWNCTEPPCTDVSAAMSLNEGHVHMASTNLCFHPTIPPPPTTPTTTSTTTTEEPSSMPVWAWVLIGAVVVGGAVAGGLFFSTKDPPKKKRAVKAAPPRPQPTIAEPLPVYQPVMVPQGYMAGPR